MLAAASGGMVLYSKIHEDITPTSQAERQREGQFQYRRVRVFGGGNLLWSGLPRLFAFSSLHLPARTKGKIKSELNESCSFVTSMVETKEPS